MAGQTGDTVRSWGKVNRTMASQVYWAVLMERQIISDCVDSLMEVAAYNALKGYVRLRPKYGRTDYTRNNLAQLFLSLTEQDDDVLVMLDNDHLHPPSVVEALAVIEKPVVGALAFKRGAPFESCAYVRANDGSEGNYHALVRPELGGLGPVDAIGHAAIAIKRSAFRQLQEHGYDHTWWRYEYWSDGGMPSEDMYFAKICARSGVTQWLNTGVVCPHHMDVYVDQHTHENYLSFHPELVRHSLPVSIIIPTRHRRASLQRSLDSLLRTTPADDREIIVVQDSDDWDEQLMSIYGDSVHWIRNEDPGRLGIDKWNLGAAQATGGWLVTGADDVEWLPGWLENALHTPNAGYIGLNDGHSDARHFSTHYILSRSFAIDVLGGVLQIPDYHAWYSDVEVAERARLADRYAFAPDAVIKHHHPSWGDPQDEIYQRGSAYYAQDQDMYTRRRHSNYPNDYPAVIKL